MYKYGRKDFKNQTYNLPLNSIIGIGRRLEKKFSSISINTIGDFVNLSDEYLRHVMGINGINLKRSLLGENIDNVADYYTLPPPKSIGNGTTTTQDIIYKKDVEKVIYFLAEKVSARLIKHNVHTNTLSLTIKTSNLKRVHKSTKICPTNSVKDLAKIAIKIADSIWNYDYPVRAIRLRASTLTNANFYQMNMFDKKQKDFSFVSNMINEKYGKIELASNMTNYINRNKHIQE